MRGENDHVPGIGPGTKNGLIEVIVPSTEDGIRHLGWLFWGDCILHRGLDRSRNDVSCFKDVLTIDQFLCVEDGSKRCRRDHPV